MEKGMKRTVRLVLSGTGWIMALTLLFCVLASALVLGGVIGQSQIETAAVTAMTLAVFLGCRIGVRGAKEGILFTALMQAGGFLVVLLLMNLLLFADVPSGALPVCGLTAAAAAVSALTASGRRKGKRHSRH